MFLRDKLTSLIHPCKALFKRVGRFHRIPINLFPQPGGDFADYTDSPLEGMILCHRFLKVGRNGCRQSTAYKTTERAKWWGELISWSKKPESPAVLEAEAAQSFKLGRCQCLCSRNISSSGRIKVREMDGEENHGAIFNMWCHFSPRLSLLVCCLENFMVQGP